MGGDCRGRGWEIMHINEEEKRGGKEEEGLKGRGFSGGNTRHAWGN